MSQQTSQTTDGLYYRHQCPDCRQATYDCLPWQLCPTCHSPNVTVEFDHPKRDRELPHFVSEPPRTTNHDRSSGIFGNGFQNTGEGQAPCIFRSDDAHCGDNHRVSI
ncbi:MAG: hypothetical protein ACYC4N_11310 [Pirellulaceae bacterium]